VGSIYAITNKETGKMYIGQTINIHIRIRQHFNGSGIKTMHIDRSINKHGAQAFSTEIIADDVPRDLLDEAERFFIWHLKTLEPEGYNIRSGGNAFSKEDFDRRSRDPHWRHVMATRNKAMSQDPKWIARNKEQSIDPEWKANHAAGLKRRATNPDWLAKVGRGPNGGPKTAEHIAHMAEANRRKAKDPDWLAKTRLGSSKRGKPVVCIDTGTIYFSIREAMRQTGASDTAILGVCKNKPKYLSAGGYRWRYATQEESISARRVLSS
jgi:group I intron endonuclease